MLIEFSVGNYKSFKEVVTFSMVAADLVSPNEELDENNVFPVDKDLKLLKSGAIYGANANCQKEGFGAAYSNEAFELWYILHFEYLNTAIPRKEYCKKLTKHLKEK